MDTLDPTTRIARELRIYTDWAEELHDPLVGLKMGNYFGLVGYSPLVMLLMTCATAYEAHFGCPLRFGEREARFWLRNEHLQLKLPTADPNAHAMYRTMCDQQLTAQEAATDTLADQKTWPNPSTCPSAACAASSAKTALPIEDIAAQIGYAESAAFIHAFRRWAGMTPREFRAQ